MAATKTPRRKASPSGAASTKNTARRSSKTGGASAGKAAKAAAGRKPAGKSKAAGKRAAAAPAATKSAAKKRIFGEINGPNEQLWRDYAKSRNPELRNQLMEMYLPVVQFIAERLLLTLPRSIDVDDLKSAGVFGLMDAIDGFDLSRGIKFKSYCTTRIRGSIHDELRSQDWVVQ